MHMQFLTYDCIGLTEVSSEKWLGSEHSVSNKAFKYIYKHNYWKGSMIAQKV